MNYRVRVKFWVCQYLKIREFIIALIDAQCEIQTGIAAVHYFMISELYIEINKTCLYLKKIGVFRFPLHNLSMHFDLYFPALGLVVRHVPPWQARLSLPVLQQNEADLTK